MDFKYIFSAWGNDGKEPSEELQLSGFKGGQKPAASVFNWFWSKVMKAVTELQMKLTSVDNNKAKNIIFPAVLSAEMRRLRKAAALWGRTHIPQQAERQGQMQKQTLAALWD